MAEDVRFSVECVARGPAPDGASSEHAYSDMPGWKFQRFGTDQGGILTARSKSSDTQVHVYESKVCVLGPNNDAPIAVVLRAMKLWDSTALRHECGCKRRMTMSSATTDYGDAKGPERMEGDGDG